MANALACPGSAVAVVDDQGILLRVARGGIHIGEGELRYQLERKDNHPLARKPELLDVLAELEAHGLIEAELCFRLTREGRARLAEPATTSGRAER
jgi:hypothetical protein